MTLQEFIKEMKSNLESFEKDYIENNKVNPEYYPLEIQNDNDGVWFEMLEFYLSNQGE